MSNLLKNVLIFCSLFSVYGFAISEEKRFLIKLENGFTAPIAKVLANSSGPQLSESNKTQKFKILRTEQYEKVDLFKALSTRSANPGNVSAQSVGSKVTWATVKAQGFKDAVELESFLKQRYSGVAHVEEDVFVKPSSLATEEPLTRGAWQYGSTANSAGGSNIFSAWLRATGQGVVVAVLDNGVTDHPDLRATMSADRASFIEEEVPLLAEPGFSPGLVCAQDGVISWHGTAMQGIIGAAVNGEGVAGVAHNSKVMPVRVLGPCGGWLSDIARGIRWSSGEAVESTPAPVAAAKVINLSLGAPANSCPLFVQEAINAATARGAIVVASAGNTGEAAINYPAACNNVIAVTAHTFTGDRADYAAYSNQVAISAPGGGRGIIQQFVGPGLNTTSNTGVLSFGTSNYAISQGTSPAAAIVSGVIALAKELEPALTVVQVKEMLRATAVPWAVNTTCPGNGCGPGLLDAFAFLNAIDPPVEVNPPVVEPVSSGIPSVVRVNDSLVIAWDVASNAAGNVTYSVEATAKDGQFASVPFSLTPLLPQLIFRVPGDWAGRVVDLTLTATNIFGQQTRSMQTIQVQSTQTAAPSPTTQPPPSSGTAVSSSAEGGGGSVSLMGLFGLALLLRLHHRLTNRSISSRNHASRCGPNI